MNILRLRFVLMTSACSLVYFFFGLCSHRCRCERYEIPYTHNYRVIANKTLTNKIAFKTSTVYTSYNTDKNFWKTTLSTSEICSTVKCKFWAEAWNCARKSELSGLLNEYYLVSLIQITEFARGWIRWFNIKIMTCTS